MEYTDFEKLLRTAFAKNELEEPSDKITRSFHLFTNFLLKTNETTNLTAIHNTADIVYKHYVDSLLASRFIPQGAKILDVGCGAGFPSVPLAICRPDISITALDSTAKKIAFVKESSTLLGLSNLTTVCGRAEDRVIRSSLKDFDVVTGRAVAGLNVLCELCVPYLKINGILIALKGAKAHEELNEAATAIHTLGGVTVALHSITLHTDTADEARGLIEIVKKFITPSKYPRSYAAILKKPL